MENEGRIYSHPEKVESPSEKSFSIIWEIENAKYFHQAGFKLQSPVIFVDVLERTGWRLVLCRLHPEEEIYVSVKREAEDDGPEKFDLHYEFDINLIKEGAWRNKPRSHIFRKNESGPPILLYKINSLTKSGDYSRSNIITLKCIMRKNNGHISMSGQCTIRTQIGGEDFEFIGKVENFSSLTIGAKRTLKVLSSSSDETLMTVNLILKDCSPYHGIFLHIIPAVEKSDYSYFFSSTILDCSGNETNFRKEREHTLKKAEEVILYFRKKSLKKYADWYLPNDTLSVLCRITLHTGIKSEKVGEIEYGTVSSEDLNQKTKSSLDLETSILAATPSLSVDNDPKSLDPYQNKSSIVSECHNNLTNPIPSVLEDLMAFYKKDILCDAKLQTTTETFPAHKAILSARSPVFEAMFTSNMKEKIEESVHIDDVDAETVKRMLLFLYSDSLEELEWSDAKKLYFAADKYQVISLKHRCDMILKKSIDLSNCCELLLLAHMHQDKDLKAAVQSYIARYDKEVFLSDQWRDLEMSHPLLAINVLRAVHIK